MYFSSSDPLLNIYSKHFALLFSFCDLFPCNRWSMLSGIQRMSWCLHTTSTRWHHSWRIQELLMSSKRNSWMAEVRGHILKVYLEKCMNIRSIEFSMSVYYHVIKMGETKLLLLFLAQQWLVHLMCTVLQPAVMFGKWTDHVKSWRHTELTDIIYCLCSITLLSMV